MNVGGIKNEQLRYLEIHFCA